MKAFTSPPPAPSGLTATQHHTVLAERGPFSGSLGAPVELTDPQPCASIGRLTVRCVPAPGGLWIEIVPPSASPRSLIPIRPDPFDGSAPPVPSSLTETWRTSPAVSSLTWTADAFACL